MKRIVVATDKPENELMRLVAFMLKGAGFKAEIADFDVLYTDKSNVDVLLCNYSLCNIKELTFEMRDRADAVFVTDCIEKDAIVSIWTGTPHLRIAHNQDMLLKLIASSASGEGYEIERKFLIEYPDIAYLNSLNTCRAVNMEQVYLNRGLNGESLRVRKRWVGDASVFVKTEKQKISDTVRIEKEYELTFEQYQKELENADFTLNPIIKTRYCLMYNDVYYEIDVFPFWKKQAYLEVELSSEDEKIEIPPFIKLIREVTQDKRYTNHSLAHSVLPEE